jgi:hypothetical protein
MKRRSLGLLVALVAIAMLPATATASPLLIEGGVAVKAGAEISATNVGNVVKTFGAGNLICSSSTLRMKLLANTGSAIEAEVEKATFTGTEAEGRCPGPFGPEKVTARNLPWCLKAGGTLGADAFELRGGKCGEAAKSITWTIDTATIGECSYARASPLTGGFTTNGTQAHLSIAGQELIKELGSSVCFSAFKLDATYTLETTASPFAALTIS